jgi:putative redox protein
MWTTRSCSRAATPLAAMVKVTAKRRQGFTHDVEIQGGHRLVIDEPEIAGGANEGPSPTRTVGAALAACTAITLEMYAARKGWDVGELQVEVDMEYADHSVPRSFDVTVHVPGDLSSEQAERLRAIAAKCPVHRLLAHDREVTVTDRVEVAG